MVVMAGMLFTDAIKEEDLLLYGKLWMVELEEQKLGEMLCSVE